MQLSRLERLANGTSREFNHVVRQAEGVDDPDLREKLLRQAREWMQAEMDEEDGADIKPLSG